MKFVEDFRNLYEGKEVLIVGAGPSLAAYPKDFLVKPKGKIAILVNFAIFAFPQLPETYYWIASHPEIILEMRKAHPEILKKSILVFPFVPKFNGGGHFFSASESLDMLRPYQDGPIFLKWHHIIGKKKLFLQLLQPTVKAVMEGKSCKLICFNTIVHYAIQVAVIFGARKVTLIGCEARADGATYHLPTLERYYIELRGRVRSKGKKGSRFKNFRFGTTMLAREFKKYGVDVRRHFFDTGYEEIK